MKTLLISSYVCLNTKGRIRRMLLGRKELNLFYCLAYVVHVSLPYFSVLTTQALYTAVLVFTVSLGLVHTREVRRASVLAALPIILSICVQGEVVSDDGAKICELFNRHRAHSYRWWWLAVPLYPAPGRLSSSDGQSEILAGLREMVHQCLQLLLDVGCHCCIVRKQYVSNEGFTNLCLGSEAAKTEKPAIWSGPQTDSLWCCAKGVSQEQGKEDWRSCGCQRAWRSCRWTAPSLLCLCRRIRSCYAILVGSQSLEGSDEIKRLCEANESDIQGHLLFSAHLLELTKGEDRVCCWPSSSEAPLWFRIDTFCQLLQSDQDHHCKDFASDAEKGDAYVVIAVAPISLVLEECDDLGVPHVLWYSSFLPALTEEYTQRMQ